MSMYYSPEIVKLLMEERLREAQEARRAGDRQGDPPIAARPSRFAGSIGRILGGRARRPAPAPVACTC